MAFAELTDTEAYEIAANGMQKAVMVDILNVMLWVALGLLAADGTAKIQRAHLLDNTAAFAVSVEPPGGSPTGAPTGPIISVGAL